MDFQVNIQTDFELQVEQFLHELLERGYSRTGIQTGNDRSQKNFCDPVPGFGL